MEKELKYTVWLTHGDAERLKRLTERLNSSHTEVGKAALKLSEDGLDAIDAARNRPTSMSFEVMTGGSKEV